MLMTEGTSPRAGIATSTATAGAPDMIAAWRMPPSMRAAWAIRIEAMKAATMPWYTPCRAISGHGVADRLLGRTSSQSGT